MFLKKNERIDFGLLLKIYATKHRICLWIFKNKNKTNQPVNKKPLVQCSTWNNRLVPHQERNVSMLYVVTLLQFSSVQSLSHVQLFVTPWTAARQASLSITNFQSLLKLMTIESVMPSNHLILCCPLLLLPLIFPSIRVFPNESVLPIMWPQY